MINSRVVGIVATVIVAVLVVAGLFAVGSPGTARDLRADEQRRQRLVDLHFELAQRYASDDELPASLDDLDSVHFNPSYDPRRDPQTGEFFEYQPMSGPEYEICVVFNASSAEAEGFRGFPEIRHDAGRNCYDRDATEDPYGREMPFPDFQEGVGDSPVVPKSPSPESTDAERDA